MVLKELISLVSTFRWCYGLERNHFQQFLLWEGVVALKELILKISTLGGCGGHERTHS